MAACSVCGQALPPDARFCPNCGTAVTAIVGTEERKIVTLIFVDIVDSTGLAQRLDPERARDIQGRFFDAANDEIVGLRGRPEKFIGDAVMAVFGLPQVHEDDALRAVRAGLAIRGRARRLGESIGLPEPLEVRVGIESGEAAVGSGPSGQVLVTGAAVNAAARLQSSARPGEVLVGKTAHALTATKVSFGRRRRVKAKGFAEALEAFPVEGLSRRSARRTIPFVGRASEQAVLDQSLGLAASTGRPVLVTVIGEPGIGKSRLVDELAAGISAAVPILRGQPRSDTDTATFSPAAAIIADLAGLDGTERPERVLEKLGGLVSRCCDAAQGPRAVQRLALLFGVSDRPEQTDFVQEVQAGFITVIDGLARDHPVLLLFDDVHELKPPMQDLIERIAIPSQSKPRRALVLALARGELLEQRPAWGSSSGNAVLLRLDPLSREDAIRLVRHAGGGRIDEATAAEIANHAGGNPFFIIETTGMLMPDGEGSTPSAALLPPTVQAVVASRLDALPARLRDVARRASVFKYSFSFEELAVIDPVSTPKDLHQLEDAEVIVRDERSTGGEPQWRLRHDTLKQVAYASLSKRDRVRLHEQVANFLASRGSVALTADHLELAALASLDLDPNDRAVADRAADALLSAADRARRRMENRSAIDRYQRALALSGEERGWGGRESRMLAGIGEAYYWLGDYPAAIAALDRAVALGEAHGDLFALALALRFLGDIAINYEADVDKAARLLDRSLEAANQLGDPWAIVRTLLFAGWVPWTRRHYEESERIWRRALNMVDPEDHWARIRALTALSINRSEMTDQEGALELIDEAVALAETKGDQFSVANTAVQKGRSIYDLGRYEEALRWFDRGIAIFAEVGARWELADARAARGIAKRELGRLGDAEEDLRFAIRTAEELGDRQLPGWTWRNLARVAELRGDQAEAEELMRRSREAQSRSPQ